MIADNIKVIKDDIQRICNECGRDVNSVTLIDVSKTKPVEMVMEAYEAGERDFGENKVQELTAKFEVCPKDIRWHMIGHLQTNKIKYIIDKAYLIHSVDTYHLAEAIHKEAAKRNKVMDILLEVNVAEEESKFGLGNEEVLSMVRDIAQLSNVRIKGLMTVAPFTDHPEENRVYFRKLKQLSVDITKENIDNVSMSVLSMGMSGDYHIAIEEGATYIRIGTNIFGVRDYKGANE